MCRSRVQLQDFLFSAAKNQKFDLVYPVVAAFANSFCPAVLDEYSRRANPKCSEEEAATLTQSIDIVSVLSDQNTPLDQHLDALLGLEDGAQFSVDALSDLGAQSNVKTLSDQHLFPEPLPDTYRLLPAANVGRIISQSLSTGQHASEEARFFMQEAVHAPHTPLSFPFCAGGVVTVAALCAHPPRFDIPVRRALPQLTELICCVTAEANDATGSCSTRAIKADDILTAMASLGAMPSARSPA